MSSGSREGKAATTAWADLDPAAKTDRLLAAAELVFSEHGLGAPMPEIARAAGAGVGSLYRQFASKDELIAALAARRLTVIEAAAGQALTEADAWAALEGFVWAVLGERGGDEVAAEAVVAAAGTLAAVRAQRERVFALIDALVARAREQGVIRPDATMLDVRLVIAGARSVKQMAPDAWRRMAELALAGLRPAGRRPPGAG
jgi:AcrR family transcriptional regulator